MNKFINTHQVKQIEPLRGGYHSRIYAQYIVTKFSLSLNANYRELPKCERELPKCERQLLPNN